MFAGGMEQDQAKDGENSAFQQLTTKAKIKQPGKTLRFGR